MRSFVDLCLGFGKFAFVFLSSVSSLAKVYFGFTVAEYLRYAKMVRN